MIWRASSRIALTPLPGSRPACAETPRTIISNCPTPLRLVLSAPPGSDGSNTSTASLFVASASISAREVVLPVSSSVVHSMTMRQSIERAALDQRARRQRGEADAGLHVEHAGPMQLAAFALQRHALELADRPHRVEVAEQQDLPRARAEAGAQVIAGGRRTARA